MGSESNNNILFGAFVNSLSILVKEHPETKFVFREIKSRFKEFSDKLCEKSGNAIELIQTGSSFDDLHMCRYMASGQEGKSQFHPPTDFDYMMMYSKYRVQDETHIKHTEVGSNTHINQAISTSEAAFMMVQSAHLGYVQMLVTDKGREMLLNKRHKKWVIPESGFVSSTVFRDLFSNEPNTEVIYRRVPRTDFVPSGPALSMMDDDKKGRTYDFVFAFPCDQWPAIADRWSKRPRDAHWPCQSLIDGILKDGCAIVPVGFYTSIHQDLEWRLSFNKSERKLSLALTPNQKVCYCVVKLMVKTSLSEVAILSSYMVKNMMFWFCEQQYGDGEWQDNQLGERIFQLIDYVITALEHHNIPHYFLPHNNLIRHRTKEEVQITLNDVRRLKIEPFVTLFDISKKMDIFEVRKGARENVAIGNETKALLALFTGFGQAMFELALFNYDCPEFAIRCFKSVMSMNAAAKQHIKTTSVMYMATNLVDLLKPFAIQFMQSGQVDKALALFKMMLSGAKETVTTAYPNAITNIACLEAYKLDGAKDNSEREKLQTSANDHFTMALRYVKDSPTLHLAYGNFLKDSKTSVLKAMNQYRIAITLDDSRQDDEALIQMALPGRDGGKAKAVYMSGKTVAYFSLISILVDVDDIYEARVMVKKLEQHVSMLDLTTRKKTAELCYHAFAMVGLRVKGHLAMCQFTKEN